MSRLHRLPAVLVVAAAFAALAALARADGPLAIHSPALLTPPETAGAGIAPEVAVKLAIDARGKVTSVQVLSITPASEYDALFRDAVIDTLSHWRFSPATKDGHTVESSLDFRVRFPATLAEQRMDVQVTSPLVGGDAEQRRAAVMALPQERRRKLLETQTRAAIGFLDAKRTHEAASPRFAVRSDADESVAKTVAGNLEAIFNVLARELMPGISLQAEPYKVQVVAFRTAAQYQAFTAGQLPFERSAGFYSPTGLIVFHLEQPTSDDVTSLLLHEATHAFLDRHVVRPGVALPRWLGEGFADYVGNSAIKNGRLQPGKTIRRKFGFERGQLIGFETGAGARLDEAKQALRRGEGLGLQQMLEASPEIFYGAKARLYYASSWLLVHYMRDGGGGWSENRFPQLLLYLAEGYPQTAAVRTVYGDTSAAEQAFRQYVKSF
jgi:TonB family protein